jgi:hypothetical protein
MKKTARFDTQARQGGVFLRRVDKTPPKGLELEPTKGPIVLALGEDSGHRHQVARGAKLFRRSGSPTTARFLQVDGGGATVAVTSDEGTPLTVERHAPVRAAPGLYEVTIQREWTIDQEIRRVAD